MASREGESAFYHIYMMCMMAQHVVHTLMEMHGHPIIIGLDHHLLFVALFHLLCRRSCYKININRQSIYAPNKGTSLAVYICNDSHHHIVARGE